MFISYCVLFTLLSIRTHFFYNEEKIIDMLLPVGSGESACLSL